MSVQQEHGAKPSDNSPSPPSETPAAWFEAGLRLLQAGQLAHAEQCGRNALALDQGHADSLHLMGMLCVASRQYDLAIEWFALAIRQNPDVADYFSNIGLALQRKDRFDEAIRSYDQALLLRAEQPEIWFRMGECLQQQKRNDEAIQSFEQAVRLDPQHAGAARASAMLLFNEGRHEEAIVRFDRLLAIQRDLAWALNLRGVSLSHLKRFEEALASCKRATELAPDDANIIANAGFMLRNLDRNEEALSYFDHALSLKPDVPFTLNNRALSLSALHRFDEALASFDAAIAIDPEFDRAHWNAALTRLLLGDFEKGWAQRERGRVSLGHFVDRKFAKPHWFGDEPVAGKTILLHSDEGFGDTIQYVRYVKWVAQLGARVILEVDDGLHRLLSGIDGVSACLRRGSRTLPDFDLHCPLSGLPLAFKTRLDTIPSGVPYLLAPPEEFRQAWEKRLGPHDKMRIGLVWSGSPAHPNDRNRSMRLRTMCKLLGADARFFSLQKDPRPEDRATLAMCADIIDHTEHLTDFVETAALISCLDIVITVDTGVAHLAGALARPTWILLPYAPDYRWLLDRDDSPWYPTVRLFRQGANGDYAEVVDRVHAELNAQIAAWRAPGKKALPPREETPAAWCQAGLRLLQAGHLPEAEQCGRSALALDEGHAGSLHLMGLLCAAAKRDELAVEWFTRAIRQNHAVADYFAHLGMALQRQSRLVEAIKSFDRALVLDPGQAEIWYRMGEVLQQQKRLDEAIASFDQALTVKPDYREAANASALLYFETRRYEAAIERFTRSAEIDPTQAGAFNFISLCLWPLRRLDEALANGHKALALAPRQPEIHKNIGLILQKLDRQEEALTWFDSALALRPDFPQALNDRSTTLFALRRVDEAFTDIDRAIALDPDCADYHWNRALLHLLVGRFDEGWAGREWGRKCALVGFVDRKFTQPRWFGDEPIAGKTILLHSDEGLGDTIQFCRYATEVAKLGARVILEVEAPLHPLLTGIEGVSLCLPKLTDVPLPDFDLHCPLSGLPLAFKTRLDTIPAARAYLPPLPEARLCEWQEWLGAHDRLRVGLVWSGNPSHANDRNRSMTLQSLSAILDERAGFYSLQKEPRDEDKATLAARADLIDLTGHLTDFVETAALICCLDLVVTVDTSVAHLAAALGRPTWILLPHTPDYRWLLDRDDSPWYPTARLFRQDDDRSYASVLSRVRGELERMIAEFSVRHGRA